MLQDIPTPTLREASPCVLETERLTLRRPTLADVKAIARLANDRRIAENTRRLPHPYLQDHAVDFVRDRWPMRGDNRVPDRKQFRRRSAWSASTGASATRRSSATGSASSIGARASAPRPRARAIDYFFEEFDRRPALCRRARHQPGLAQRPGEMRLPVERRRAAPLRGAGLLHPGRPLPPLPRRLVVAEELGAARRGGRGKGHIASQATTCRPGESRDL